MATSLTLRSVKGSQLTIAEVDANFTALGVTADGAATAASAAQSTANAAQTTASGAATAASAAQSTANSAATAAATAATAAAAAQTSGGNWSAPTLVWSGSTASLNLAAYGNGIYLVTIVGSGSFSDINGNYHEMDSQQVLVLVNPHATNLSNHFTTSGLGGFSAYKLFYCTTGAIASAGAGGYGGTQYITSAYKIAG